jgi:hypothetical protein
MCGQWVRPVREWDAPRSLQNFPAAGDAPIYVGFGSMVGFDQRALLNVVIAAVAGQRALFFPGWSSADSVKLPPNFCVIGDTPHDWLFPRTFLVIHHGGSGTTHSAARAGVPSVVLPFAADQFFWAEQLRRRGIAPASASGPKVTTLILSRAIAAAQTAEMRERASAVGATMRCRRRLGKGCRQSSRPPGSLTVDLGVGRCSMNVRRSRFTVHGSRLAVGGWRLNRRRSRIKDFLICVNWSSSAVEDRCRKIEPRMNPRSGRAATNGMRDPASPQAGSRLRRRKPGGLSRAFRRNQEPWRCFKSFL